MMGPRQVAQGALFYEFSLDAVVPEDHLLRSIDRSSTSAASVRIWRRSTVPPGGPLSTPS